MRRRKFITILGGAAMLAAWSFAAHAQQRKIPRIGIIDDVPEFDCFRQALPDLGYIEGQTIAFESSVVESKPEQLAVAATELVRLPVDVIATFGTQ